MKKHKKNQYKTFFERFLTKNSGFGGKAPQILFGDFCEKSHKIDDFLLSMKKSFEKACEKLNIKPFGNEF